MAPAQSLLLNPLSRRVCLLIRQPCRFYLQVLEMPRFLNLILAVLLLFFVDCRSSWGQEESPRQEPGDTATVQVNAEAAQEAVVPTAEIGEGERAAELKKSLELDQKRLAEVTAALKNQDREFNEATEALTEASAAVEAKQAEIKRLTDSGETEQATTAADELATLQKSETVAKEQLEVALQSQRTAQEQLRTLETKIAQDQTALDRLTGAVETTVPTESAPEQEPSDMSPGTQQQSSPETDPSVPAVPEEEDQELPVSEKVAEVQQKTLEMEAIAEAASRDVAEVRQRKGTLQRDIELEQKALDAARKQQDLLDATIDNLEAEYTTKSAAGEPADELQIIRKQIAETQQQLREARNGVRERTDQLQLLRNQLLGLQAEEIQLVEAAEQSRREAEKAQRSEWLITLQENVIVRGPKILSVILIMLGLLWLSRIISRRLVQLFSKSGTGDQKDREDRASTLGSVFDNAARVAIFIGGTLMILDVLGIPIGPLLGGAAVMGLAIAFGAQSLIKDYFTGFIVLLENQYKINDVITIGGMTGTVERITLRITVLRAFEGKVHFIPNGQITSVTNHTHGWARTAIDVEVAYRENVDEVAEVLRSLTAEMREDENWKDVILADPEIFGVEALGQSAVSIRIGFKVQPAKQWALKRELLRRIKNRFDELGIEIPFPQQTVYHRYEDGQPPVPQVPSQAAD